MDEFYKKLQIGAVLNRFTIVIQKFLHKNHHFNYYFLFLYYYYYYIFFLLLFLFSPLLHILKGVRYVSNLFFFPFHLRFSITRYYFIRFSLFFFQTPRCSPSSFSNILFNSALSFFWLCVRTNSAVFLYE